MNKDNKLMYDAWIDDILDDVRNNVVGEFWHPYFDTPFHKKVLKHLIQQSKFDDDSPVMGDRYDLYFKYNNYYRLENNSETHRYLYDYLGVEDKHINNILMLYAMILKHIVDTQGYEDNMLTESIDRQKEFLDKVVDRLLKESEYRFWEDKHDYTTTNKHEQHLKKIRVDIKFGLVNLWREDPIEYFDMKMVKDNLTKRRRKTEYLEDYERDQLTNIYGLNSDEIMGVIHKYYNSFYNNIYNSFLEMDEDDKIPTSKPEKWMRGDEVFDIGGRLNESLSSRVNKDVEDLFSKNKKLSNEKKIKSIFMDKYGMNKQDADQAMVIYLSKQQSLNESVIGKNDDEVIGKEFWFEYHCWESPESCDAEAWYRSHQKVRVIGRGEDDHDQYPGEVKVYKIRFEDGLEYDVFEDELLDSPEEFYRPAPPLNESIDKQGRFLDRVVEQLVKETILYPSEVMISLPGNPDEKWNAIRMFEHLDYLYNRFLTHTVNHCRDVYGLTNEEINYVWNKYFDQIHTNYYSLKKLNESTENTLKEQHYPEWDERSREQNINLLKAKGIDILSTDTNVPFYRRIDSKEIRFLKKIADRLDNESRIEVVGGDYAIDDEDFLLITPFGKFEYFNFIDEYRHRRFEKYVDDLYAVGDNQIMFPTGKSIAKTRESAFLWEMYKDKLKRKYLKLINPGMPDIPDDAIITEQDLSNDDHKSLLKSFEVMDTPEEIATEELGGLITWVKDLPKEIFLYRILYLDGVNDINYDELGSHYSQDRTDLINNHYDRGSIYGHGQGEDAYLITVKVPKSEVDVMETLNNNILYPHEKEITLKDKGRGATYLDIEKI